MKTSNSAALEVRNRKNLQKQSHSSGIDLVVSHESAVEFWRLHGDRKIDDAARLRRRKTPDTFPHSAYICSDSLAGLSCPINLMLRSQNAKRKSKVFRPHVHTGPVPDGCFVSVVDGVAVSAPELCFFQMAGELPLIRLIEYGLELCGSYSLPAGAAPSDKTLYGKVPLTNVRELKAFADRMKGVNGRKQAVRALRYIADGSASPRETILFMLLTLPYSLGGYGLPAPELNRRVDYRKNAESFASFAFDKEYYVCDLFWPEANLALEYDSSAYHVGAEHIAADSTKRSDLEVIGIKAVTVTNSQIQNAEKFETVAKVVAKKVQKQLRCKNPQFIRTRDELRDMLLP